VLTPEDEREFARWRAADPRHEAAVRRLEGAWAALQPLRDFRPEARRHPDRDLLGSPARGKMIAFPTRVMAIAAAVALMLAAGAWVRWHTAAPEPATIYATTADGYQRVVLTDGSVLELNGNTSAEVRFTPTERRVHLASGEAHFAVAKNASRPFWVEANGVSVRAVGTAFNVRLGEREVEVLVTEGKVAVSQNAGPALLAGTQTNERNQPTSRDPILVSANERALIATVRPALTAAMSAPVVERIAPETLRNALAWQEPRVVFAGTPLVEVIMQFNRHNTVQLELADPELGALPIGGSFRAENVEGFVRLLESGLNVVVERPAANRIVLHRGK
jgi:transmembrane sensor